MDYRPGIYRQERAFVRRRHPLIILGRIDLRGTCSPACGRQYAPLKPIKWNPAKFAADFGRHLLSIKIYFHADLSDYSIA